MRKIFFLIFICLLTLPTMSRDISREGSFRVPFDFPLYLSGNFGELRSNHFHGGLDFKTQGVEGKPIRCIADGYISRVSVSPGGYGNAIYITHPNGYTSVYGHLKAFLPEIARMIKEYQYANQCFVVDTLLDMASFPVHQGEVVAWAGNSGYSFGPHLHMEIRETATNEPVDPLLFYKDKIKDARPPRAKSVMLYPQKGKGLLMGGTEKRSFTFTEGNKLNKRIEAWGLIGAGISANDYMDGTNNSYGVYSITLLVDSVEVFNSLVGRFLFEENRMINSWTDYDEYRRRNKWYMKSFVEPGNPLRMLRATNDRRGLVNICEERPYHFEYVLSDLHGNTSRYRFVIHGVPQEIHPHYSSASHQLRWSRSNFLQEFGMELVIPRGMLYDDCELDVKVSMDSMSLSHVYYLGDEAIPLHSYCPLSIKVLRYPIADVTKYYIASRSGNWEGSVGGVYENGYVKTNIRELRGSFYVEVDTVPPVVEPLNRAQWSNSGVISFKISDKETGIQSYKGYVDGEFVLFEYSTKNKRLTCRLTDTPVAKGKTHTLQLAVTDMCGNVSTKEYSFRF